LFANRYTAFIDACVLVSTLRRNLLLTLAEAEFFRIRWSAEVLEETRRTIERLLLSKNKPANEAAAQALRAVAAMQKAFEEAEVRDFRNLIPACSGMPDKDDVHVLAAALKTQAATIVTENLKDFPIAILEPLNIEARSADDFIADTIALDPGRAIAAIRIMRERLKRPERSAEDLLLDMEAAGLVATVDVLRPHMSSL
jgi:predicted nucleic acid-binding protein